MCKKPKLQKGNRGEERMLEQLREEPEPLVKQEHVRLGGKGGSSHCELDERARLTEKHRDGMIQQHRALRLSLAALREHKGVCTEGRPWERELGTSFQQKASV